MFNFYDWVYDFGPLQWTFLILLIVYLVMWFTGSPYLNDPSKRFPRISVLDDYFMSEFGSILMHIRSALGFIILLICFLIIT